MKNDKWFACDHEVLARTPEGKEYHIADTWNKEHAKLIAEWQNKYLNEKLGFARVKQALKG